LFSVCDNKLMAIVDADSGKVLATPAIGEGPDAAAFDPNTRLAFSSNGESGTLTIVHEETAGEFKVTETVKTAVSARTMALDTKTHKLYLSAADMEAPATTGRRRTAKPDTFRLLVLGN
jgi:DNA-binding beta-propeller fold protein YncE